MGGDPIANQTIDSIKFFVAVGFLLLLAAFGWFRDETQFNVIFLTLLSLACAMVFVYLPLGAVAELNVGWFKAGGAAAIFGVVMWVTVPFAHSFKKDNLEAVIRSQNDLIVQLQQKQKDLESQRNEALAVKSAGDACNARSKALESYIQSSISAVDQLKASLDTVQKFGDAARSNSSDAPTCSLRASQGLQELAQSKATVEKIVSNLSAAKAAVQ